MILNVIILISLYLYLIICSITDIKTRKINLKICIIFFLLGLFINMFIIKCDIQILLYNLIPGILLLFISILTKGASGCGDAVIFIIMSFYLSSVSTFIIWFMSLSAASLFSIILIIKKFSRKYALPFAPFITFGFTLFILLNFLS